MSTLSFELWAPTVHRLTEPYCFDVVREIPRTRCQWERYEHDDGAGSSVRWKCRPAPPLTVRWTRCVDRNVSHYLHYVALPLWNSFENGHRSPDELTVSRRPIVDFLEAL